MQAVICSTCGTIVAVVEDRNINAELDLIKKKLGIS
jgi:hypothetical protein